MTRPARLTALHPAFRPVLLLTALLLSGCSAAVLNPTGAVGEQQKDLILLSFGLMLTVVIPVIVLTLYFAWRYRASKQNGTYQPDWADSKAAEAVMWGVPAVLVVILSVVTWISTHDLDPYKPLSDEPHLKVQVVSMNWKWLFIYPDFGVASVNELVLPKDVPVSFDLTSATVMNSFFIPALGSQIYTMSGMKTQVHLVANEVGNFEGISANYSGEGFADMKFNTRVVADKPAFYDWVAQTKSGGSEDKGLLDQTSFDALNQPSSDDPISTYSSVAPKLFDQILMTHMKDYGDTPFYDDGPLHPQAPRLGATAGAPPQMHTQPSKS